MENFNNLNNFNSALEASGNQLAMRDMIIKAQSENKKQSREETERQMGQGLLMVDKTNEERTSIKDNQRMIIQEKEKRAEKMKGMSILEKIKYGFDGAITEGSVDHRKAFESGRQLRSLDEEAPRLSMILGVNPSFTRFRDAMGLSNIEDRVSRERSGLGLQEDGWARTGQLAGTVGADLIQDRTRNLYWLLNAPQAVANVSQEWGLSHHAPELYQADKIVNNKGNEIILEPGNYQELIDRGLIGVTEDGHEIMRPGVNRIQSSSQPGKTALSKRRYRPGAVDSLAIPSGIAINAGVGLLDPFGGSNGYSAVFESEDDPTKTSNVIGEVAAKYVLGRTGNMLPWDEFKKVRPDVSKDEYMRYKAFKYDKEGDADLSDGTFTVPTGIIKGTTDGIHGAEIQMLGRSMPLYTTLLPTLAAGIGTTMGAKWEPEEFKEWRQVRDSAAKKKHELSKVAQNTFKDPGFRDKQVMEIHKEIAEAKNSYFKAMPTDAQARFKSINRVRNGLVSGLASYGTALVGGLALENERRRRNQNENESQQIQF